MIKKKTQKITADFSSLMDGIKKSSNVSSNFFNQQLSTLVKKTNIETEAKSLGKVLSYGDGVVAVEGLDDINAGELVDLGNDSYGLALNLEKDRVGVISLMDDKKLRAGDYVKKAGRLLSVNVSDSIIGRVVDGLGVPMDKKGAISPGKEMPLEKIAPGVITRKSVSVPLQTGVKAIDAIIPIGRGQRELIIGDRATGKTSIALGAVLNQKDQDVVCVYVCIGQKRSSLANAIGILKKHDAMKYSVVVAATASAPASQQYLVPFTGQAIAEYFLEKGKDVLIIFDDLSKHAKSYREISLLLERPSGREAYPGDIFYLHSRLLERSCCLNEDYGGGSVTALPIVETQAGDVSAYIPTNVISITDGQIYLETDLFNQGLKPAINLGLSVSRVGGSAQIKAMKQVAGTMKLDLAQLRELEAFAQFSSDLDQKTKAQLDRGLRVRSILKQAWDKPLKVEEQIMVIYAAVNGYLDDVMESRLIVWENLFIKHLRGGQQDLLDNIRQNLKLDDTLKENMSEVIRKFNESDQDLQDNNHDE